MAKIMAKIPSLIAWHNGFYDSKEMFIPHHMIYNKRRYKW